MDAFKREDQGGKDFLAGKLISKKDIDPADVIDLMLPERTRFGFSGSRKRYGKKTKSLVMAFVDSLPVHCTVISGGCRSKVRNRKTGKWMVNENTDRWSVYRAKNRGIQTIKYEPDYPELGSLKEAVASGRAHPKETYWYITKQNYTRNQAIVDTSDVLIAILMGKKGGTWDTVKRAMKKGIPVFVNVNPSRGWIRLTSRMMKIGIASW